MPKAEQSRYLRPIKRGEYDLVNISLIGRDPVTGRSYEECSDEWNRERKKLLAEFEKLRWWQFIRRRVIAWKAAALQSHLGVPPGFLG